MADQDETSRLDEFRNKLADVKPLDAEPNFLTDDTLRRYLVARKWDIAAAEKQLRSTIEWRRETKPQTVVCTNCHRQKGYHAMRQVGFDKSGRPVLYASFVQCYTQKHSTDDAVEHFLYIMENAARSAPQHVQQFVWVIDFSGMKMAACNPRIAHAVSEILANHYPEKLGACVFVNHGPVFHGFWKVVKKFLDTNTLQKVHGERTIEKLDHTLTEMLPDELKQWLLEEIRLNKQEPLSESQKEFWKKPTSGHDPRGCGSYVSEYVEGLSEKDATCTTNGVHKPHPCILDLKLEELGSGTSI